METSVTDQLSAQRLKRRRIDAVQKILNRPTLPGDMRTYWMNVLIQLDVSVMPNLYET